MNWGLYPWKKWLLAASGIAVLGVLAAYVGVSFWIGSDVRSITAEVMRAHEGDRVEALITYVDEPTHSLKERNRAVWALGQLGDQRALPVLEKYRTGQPCDHTSTLCQRELAKAVHLAGGGVNVTALVWRRDSM